MSRSNKIALWPEGELPCIWMEAGSVEFKLCDQNFDCDNCSFNAIMKNEKPVSNHVSKHSQGTALPTQNDPFRSLQNLTWDQHAYYGNRYWFVEPLGAQKALLGLNELALHVLPTLRDVILTEEGRVVKDQVIGWLLTDDGTLCLKAPFDANILKANATFLADAHERSHNVWMFTLSSSKINSELKQLHRGKSAAPLLNGNRDALVSVMQNELQAMNPSIGETMQDGGLHVGNLEQMLGSKRYFKVICQFFEHHLDLPSEDSPSA